MNKITITINSKDYIIKQSFRTFMLFEEQTGKSIASADITSFADTFKLLYCSLKACNRNTFNFSFDEFIDVIDEQPEILTKFTDFVESESNISNISEDNKKKEITSKLK